MAALGAPWDDEEAEYQVLVDLLLPSAQARFDLVMRDWEAVDTKSLALLALDAALIAGLVAAHDSLYHLWWIVVLACLAAGGLLLTAILPRSMDIGYDFKLFHDEMRDAATIDSARLLFNDVLRATESAEGAIRGKARLYAYGLAAFVVCLIACFPIVLFA